jgi:hypothetical protein
VIGADHPSRSNVAEPLNTLDSVQNGATVVESRADDYRCRAAAGHARARALVDRRVPQDPRIAACDRDSVARGGCSAEQCLEMATTFHNHQARDILLHMAHVWLRLAEDNHEMVARSKAAEEGQPVVQQQEQIQPKKEGE